MQDWRPSDSDLAGLVGLDEAARDRIRAGGRIVAAAAGQVLFSPGTECGAFMWLVSGTIRVHLVAESGREITLYRVVPGETCVLTTACLMAQEDYGADGVAESDIRAIAIPTPLFHELLSISQRFRELVFAAFGARISAMLASFEEVAFGRLDRRLASFLLERAGNAPVALTHQDIAGELGSSREVISRLLKEFERRDLIRLGRGRIEMRDPQALDQLARSGLGSALN